MAEKGNHAVALEGTGAGEKLRAEIGQGALHDVVADWLGYRPIPMHVLDFVTALWPFIWLVLTVWKRDIRLWTKCGVCGSLLALGTAARVDRGHLRCQFGPRVSLDLGSLRGIVSRSYFCLCSSWNANIP